MNDKSLTKLKPYFLTYVQRIISGYFLLGGYKKLLSAERRFLLRVLYSLEYFQTKHSIKFYLEVCTYHTLCAKL